MELQGKYLNKYIKALRNKRGAEMVEGAISLPLIILTAMLLLRTFTFYLEILNTSVSEHLYALEKTDEYRGSGFQVYKNTKDVSMLRGGISKFDVKKEIYTKCYMLNEDLMVRAGEVFK